MEKSFDFKIFFKMVFDEIKIIGKSQTITTRLKEIKRVAESDKNVLIIGETGTGKELAAKKLHQLSRRKDRPFVAINCANIPDELFETEFFGHVKGAFTGAIREKAGLLEIAGEGTVFLDEIGDLSLHLQTKLLRIIEERELRKIGDVTTRRIQARYIFATNKNLREEIKKGKFRIDLYYRINVMRLFIPPLKERKEDIPLLLKNILEKENRKKEQKKGFSPCAVKKLMVYDYPGNIRELENIIERALVLSEGNTITEKDVLFDFECEISSSCRGLPITPEQLRNILEKCRWNKTKAAAEIGKSRRQFYRLLEKYQMTDCIRKN